MARSAHPQSPMIDGLVHYQVLARWARGGMADVYVARQVGKVGFDKLVALKVLRGDLLHDQELRDMFIQEARTAVLLNHPRIIQTYDAEEAGDNLYLVMEFVRGETLRHVVRRVHEAGDRLPTPFALEVASQIGLALDYAHRLTDLHGKALGLVHRDVAPSNIMLTDQGGTKLLDFGIAKVAAAGHATDAGTVKGKFAYMSPEQVRGQALDGRSDVYALGLVLWELLTGERALTGERDVDVIQAALKPNIPPPSTAGGPKIEAIDRLVGRALAVRADARIQTARELAEEAQRLRVRLFPEFNMSACVRDLLDRYFADRRRRLDELLSSFEDSSSPETFSPLDLETQPSAEVGVSGPRTLAAPIATTEPPATEPRRGRWPLLAVAVVLLVLAMGAWLTWGARGPSARDVIVTTEPPGATVSAAGEVLGRTPLVVHVEEGAPKALTFSRLGYAETSRIVSASEAEGVTVRLARSEASGTVTVRSTPPGAHVSVDGRPQPGVTPLVVDGLWLGSGHRVTVSLEGHESAVRAFELPAEGELELSFTLTPLTQDAVSPAGEAPTVAREVAAGMVAGMTRAGAGMAPPRASRSAGVGAGTGMATERDAPDSRDPAVPEGEGTPRAAPTENAAMTAPEAPVATPPTPPPLPPPLPTRATAGGPPPQTTPRPEATRPPQATPPPRSQQPPRGDPEPTVRMGMPRITGVVNRGAVRRRLNALLPRLRDCTLAGSPRSHTVRLRFVIDGAGRARDVSAGGDGAGACLTRALRSAPFPPSTASDAIVQVDLDVRAP